MSADYYVHPHGLELHLGGHENETHIDVGALDYLTKKFDVKTMIDIGCGPGGMVKHAKDKGLRVIGVDGDHTVTRDPSIRDNVIIHDYAKSSFSYPVTSVQPEVFDLGWCVEFVEHVEKRFMPNFLKTFKQCRYVMMTHALPNQPGHHHVNCMPAEYWFGVMDAIGFSLLVNETNEVRQASTMTARYIRQQGYLFKNERVPSLQELFGT